MIRQWIFQPKGHHAFKIRGHEVYRIEALSDAVIAFSVSILVASLEAPQTYAELLRIMQGVIPFFATVSVLFILWYQQNRFFRHYGLNDKKIIYLNLAYLALILFYVYPLKFLFSVLLMSFTGLQLFPEAAEHQQVVITQTQFPVLIILFSLGYSLIWFLIWQMHHWAMKKAGSLQLTDFEKAYTQKEIRGAIGNMLLGLLAILFALIGLESLAGICYLLIPVLLLWNDRVFRRTAKKWAI